MFWIYMQTLKPHNLAVVSIWVNSAMESKGHDNAREEKVIPKQSFHILIFVL